MRKIGLSVMLVVLAGRIFAQTEAFSEVKNPDELKKSINQMSAETNTIHSDFVQEKYMEILSNKLVSKGTISFKKPNKLRWEYHDPFSYIVILNDNKMVIKDDKKTNTIDIASSKVFQEINQMIINIIQGNILDSPQFDIQYFQSTSEYKVQLNSINKDMKSIINSIEIVFDKDDYSVVSIKLLEPGGDFTSIFFKNRKLNQAIDDAAFSIH